MNAYPQFVAISGGPKQRHFHVGRGHTCSATTLTARLHRLCDHVHFDHSHNKAILIVPDASLPDFHKRGMALEGDRHVLIPFSRFKHAHLDTHARGHLTHVSGSGGDDHPAASGSRKRAREADVDAAAQLRQIGLQRHADRAAALHRQRREEEERRSADEAARVAAEHQAVEAMLLEQRAKQVQVDALVAKIMQCVVDVSLVADRMARARSDAEIISLLETALRSIHRYYGPETRNLLPAPADSNSSPGLQAALEQVAAAVTSMVHALDTNHHYVIRYGSAEMRQIATLVRRISEATDVVVEFAPIHMVTERDADFARELQQQEEAKQPHRDAHLLGEEHKQSDMPEPVTLKTETTLGDVAELVSDVRQRLGDRLNARKPATQRRISEALRTMHRTLKNVATAQLRGAVDKIRVIDRDLQTLNQTLYAEIESADADANMLASLMQYTEQVDRVRSLLICA